MKLIIDIDEKDFKFIKSVKRIMKNSDTFQRISADLFNAVKSGEVVYPMSIAPIADNKETNIQYHLEIKDMTGDTEFTSVSTGYATYTAEDKRTCHYCKHHNTSETLQCACRECINYDRWERK